MHILVTGGAGYVGSHTVRWLSEAGHEVWVYDDLSYGHAQAVPAGRLIQGRLDDASRLADALRQHAIEAVVHFAALIQVGESVRQPDRYWRNNVVGSLSLLEAMCQGGVGRIVFSSTAAVYGTPAIVPIPEESPLQPINPYGATKLTVERMLADYARALGLAATALRYFNAAGASAAGDIGEHHRDETHLIPLVLQTALGLRSAIEIYGTDYPTPDGTCIRDYVHVEDLAQAHLLALERLQLGRFQAYNVGTGQGHSVREIIETARQVTGREIPVVHRPRREGDPPALVAASDKIRRDLGWQPRYLDRQSILESAWRWHRSHPRGYDSC